MMKVVYIYRERDVCVCVCVCVKIIFTIKTVPIDYPNNYISSEEDIKFEPSAEHGYIK